MYNSFANQIICISQGGCLDQESPKFSDGGPIAEFLKLGGQNSKLFIVIWSKDKLFQRFEIVIISEKMGHHPNLE